MDYIGIDLHKTSSQVCILTQDGELIEYRIKTDKESFDKLFAATLDDSSRFLGAKHVRSYLGLVPREYSSGERQRRGRISKAGSVRARSLLVEAALALLQWKTEKTKALHEWWARIAQCRGKATPIVVLARKLAGITFAVWRDGTEFDSLLLRPGGKMAET